MDPISLFLLGLLQGLTEFLPVSSSGHLVLAQRLMELQPSLAVNIGLHAGSLVAILFYYRRDVANVLRALLPRSGDHPETGEHRRLVLHLILATLATAPVALALRDPVEGLFSEPAAGRFLALTFFLTALLLVLTELHRRRDDPGRPGDDAGRALTWRGALLIGLVQGIAVFPGISRSGATIAAALLLGLGAEKAARFSFLLALPIIGGAALLEVPALAGDMNVWHLLLGMTAAAVSGLAALVLLVGLVRRRRFVWFAAYLAPLALACLLFNP
jgi:undecaprenyl-diphosphatase